MAPRAAATARPTRVIINGTERDDFGQVATFDNGASVVGLPWFLSSSEHHRRGARSTT